MQEYVSNNKYSLLNIRLKYNWFIVYSFINFLLIIAITSFVKTYDSLKYTGIVLDNKIVLKIPSSKLNSVINSEYIKIDDEKIEFLIESVGEIEYDEESLINYQIVILSTSNNYMDNLTLEITFYNNKQRIITKIINLLK